MVRVCARSLQLPLRLSLLLLTALSKGQQPRIVGGDEISPKFKYNFMVNVLKGYPQNSLHRAIWCGGSLIADKWVITAGHCVHNRIWSSFSVGVYLHMLIDEFDDPGSRESDCSEVIEVQRVILHPRYDQYQITNDIALLHLEKAPRCLENIGIPALANATPPAGTSVIAAGWGALWDPNSDSNPSPLPSVMYPTVPHEVTLNITPDVQCKDLVGESALDVTLCAGAGGGKDTCFGDSGGPLFMWFGVQPVLVGLTSWGNSCADTNPGFAAYTRLSSFGGPEGWIEQCTAGNCGLSFFYWLFLGVRTYFGFLNWRLVYGSCCS